MNFKGFLDGAEHDISVEPIDDGYEITINGTTHRVDSARLEANFYSLIVGGRSFDVSVDAQPGDLFQVRHGGYLRDVRLIDPLMAAAGAAGLGAGGPAQVTAVMPGRVVKMLVSEGDEVEEGQGLIVLEAMKMENEVAAPRAGKVTSLVVEVGQALETGETIAIVGD